jgi:hypothetical protein
VDVKVALHVENPIPVVLQEDDSGANIVKMQLFVSFDTCNKRLTKLQQSTAFGLSE